MNQATRSKFVNILTALATLIGVFQTLVTSPPFNAAAVIILGTVLTYLMLVITTWKQYMSNDISNNGAKVTIIIAIAATLTGALNFLDVFHVSSVTVQWIKWSVSVVVLALNVLSKTIFPSISQTAKMDVMSKLN